jgi:sec-independent protein translocase protein TatA
MGMSLTNILVILFIVLILFGAGKIPKVMGDIGKGIKNFKSGLKDEDDSESSDNVKLTNDKDKNEKL